MKDLGILGNQKDMKLNNEIVTTRLAIADAPMFIVQGAVNRLQHDIGNDSRP